MGTAFKMFELVRNVRAIEEDGVTVPEKTIGTIVEQPLNLQGAQVYLVEFSINPPEVMCVLEEDLEKDYPK